jgi:ParB/RepB/Spo0J family partition protein
MEILPKYSNAVELEIRMLKPPAWILRPIDNGIVSELVRSIQHMGLLQPIAVRSNVSGFEVVFGNHRLEACKRLGWEKIPSIVHELSDDEAFLARVSENLVRNTEVNSLEEAKGYKMLVNHGWTLHLIGDKIGKSDSYVCQRLAMLDRLDERLLTRLKSDRSKLRPSHMELLSTIRDKGKQQELAHLVEEKGLSVRTLENILRGIPCPTRVLVEQGCPGSQCSVQIPEDFARALNLTPGRSLRMFIRGKTLILEARDSRRSKELKHEFTRVNAPENLLSQSPLLGPLVTVG